jgi:hypothetical protein
MTLRRSTTRPTKSRANWTSAKTALSNIVGSHPYFVAAAASAVAMAASAFVNERLAAAAERRPSQIRASAAESALMIPGAFAAHMHYTELKMPVVIVAGRKIV